MVPRVKPLRPWAKAGIVLSGTAVAFAVAWTAVWLRLQATQGPVAQASSGMYAFGDSVLGVGVFGLLEVVPLALALYWLRPVTRFWSVLLWGAMPLALTGWLALATLVLSTAYSSVPMLLAELRFGLMPLGALGFLVCALFAPRPRPRWLLVAAAVSDAGIFTGIVLVHFVLPTLARG